MAQKNTIQGGQDTGTVEIQQAGGLRDSNDLATAFHVVTCGAETVSVRVAIHGESSTPLGQVQNKHQRGE